MATQLRILVAEDEPLNALALQAQLEALGHEVVGPARNGREAIELARTHSLELAILDIRMPEVSGLEAAREIFRITPIPILLLTGYSDPDFIAQATRSPVFHYLVKPVSLADLAPAISVARNRFQEWLHFTDEAAQIEREIRERKVIEQAKGILIQARGLSEEEALALLNREAENRGLPMAEIARTIVAAHSLLRPGQS
ncbi:MAG: response regulator [Gemmatimonadetes bacterium]|nr:response regulator [Gemmatimonadota bacterium]